MQQIVQTLRESSAADVWLVSVNTAEAEAYVPTYAQYVTDPILQDELGNPVHALLGAASYNVWVIDREATVRFAHPNVVFPGDEETLQGELLQLLEESSP